jgi:hypothetical protein
LHDIRPPGAERVLRYDRYVPSSVCRAACADDRPLRQTELLQSVHRVAFSGVAAILYRTGDDFRACTATGWLDDT